MIILNASDGTPTSLALKFSDSDKKFTAESILLLDDAKIIVSEVAVDPHAANN